MDVTTDSVNQSKNCDQQSLRTDCVSNGNNSSSEKAEKIDDEGSVTIENGSHLINLGGNFNRRKKSRLETTQLFKGYVSNVKKQIGEKKQAEWTQKQSSGEPRLGNHRLRYQKARKSTNPVQSSVFPFLLCFASKPKSGKLKENGDTVNSDDAKELESEADEDLMDCSNEADEILENNSIRILTSENDNQGSSDAVLELTFDEPKKDLNAKESETIENSVQIKKEISDEMLENNSIKIVTENDVQGSSDAILELTFDEPRKNSDERTESDDELVKIKKELINDEMLENNSIKIVTENDVQGSSDAILELTFDEPRKISEPGRIDSHEDSLQIKKETINEEILEHNSIKIVTAEKDNQGSSDAILELTFDEPKKN